MGGMGSSITPCHPVWEGWGPVMLSDIFMSMPLIYNMCAEKHFLRSQYLAFLAEIDTYIVRHDYLSKCVCMGECDCSVKIYIPHQISSKLNAFPQNINWC